MAKRGSDRGGGWWVIVAIAVGGLAGTSWGAGVVRMLDGRSIEGTIAIENGNAISVRTAGSANVRVELEQVFSATFKSPPPTSGRAGPGRWIGRDIGPSQVPGSARFVEDSATVRAAGGDIGGNNDSGYFVSQPLEGDGQIIARVGGIQLTHPQAKAGLMIRAGADPNLPNAAILAQAGGGVRFQYRQGVNAGTRGTDLPGAAAPCWLKLVRQANTLTAYWSENGEDWEQVGSAQVPLPRTCQAGLAVAARNPEAVCTASFERVAVGSGSAVIETRGTDPPADSATIRGVLLRQGSLLAGEVRSVDDSVLKLSRGEETTIPVAEVARVYFAPLKLEVLQKLTPGRTGLLLTNGDFLQGQVVRIEHGRARLSSVLFGLSWFDRSRVAAAVLRDVAPAPTRYEVRSADGSELLADRIGTERNALVVEGRSFGTVKLPPEQIAEVRVGASRFTWLAQMKPTTAQGEPAASGLASLSFGGQGCAHPVAVRAGSSVTYDLGGNYSLLVFRGGMPESILPVTAIRLIVSADGKDIYQSQPLTSVDDPLSATLSVRGVRSLVLRVDGGPTGQVGAVGVFAEAALVK